MYIKSLSIQNSLTKTYKIQWDLEWLYIGIVVIAADYDGVRTHTLNLQREKVKKRILMQHI